MEQLPKIVVQRLEAAEKVEVHPDADLLAAFIENSLGERERAAMLEHLSKCGACREVVSLSLPQLEVEYAAVAAAASAPAVAPVRSSWFGGPLLRWGALAACVVIVGAIVVMRHESYEHKQLASAERREEPAPVEDQSAMKAPAAPEAQTMVKVEPPPAPAPAEALPESRSAAATSSDATKQSAVAMQKKVAAPPLFAQRSGAAAVARAKPETAMANAAPREALSFDSVAKDENSKEITLPAAAGPKVSVAQSGAATGAVDVAIVGGRPTAQQSESVSVEAAAAQPEAQSKGINTVEDKAAQPPGNAASNGILFRAATNTLLPRFTLSPDGRMLMRSVDGGKTWQPVPLGRNVVFRALDSVGIEVWVGGSAGVLYHSSDAGQHWAQVKPIADGKSLRVDIIHIEFTDVGHGKLTTANGEIWTTADAGQSWHQ